jgi:hypothetical protein
MVCVGTMDDNIRRAGFGETDGGCEADAITRQCARLVIQMLARFRCQENDGCDGRCVLALHSELAGTISKDEWKKTLTGGLDDLTSDGTHFYG